MIRRESELFFNALRFFTRVPVPAWVGHSTELLNHAARYFPLVGWFIGAAGAGVFLASAHVLPLTLAVLLSMTTTILLTGAFHEDGFADACDGFGGGWDRVQVLSIMKDSRIGAYGTIGITLMLGAKFVALAELSTDTIPLALLAAHPLSRLSSTVLIFALDYVRDDESARAKPLAHRLSGGELSCAALFGIAPLALFAPVTAGCILLTVALISWGSGRYLRRRIGGYTGDCLGAVQQLAELGCYLALHVAWNFT